MTAIGHRVTFIKGGVQPTAPFFPFRAFVERGSVSLRSDHGSGKKNRSGMIPARYASHLCLGSAYGPESYWRDIHLPLLSSPSPAAFFSLPFSLVSYRCLPTLFKYGGHTGSCDRSPRLVTRVVREGRRAKTSRRGLTGPP